MAANKSQIDKPPIDKSTIDDESRARTLRLLCVQIKQQIDYKSFYLRFCPQARIHRNRLQAMCPLPSHAHTGKGAQSLSVDLRRGLFHCFSRNAGGDCIEFYELMHGVSFPQAVKDLAAELGLSNTVLNAKSTALPWRAARKDSTKNKNSTKDLAREDSIVDETLLDEPLSFERQSDVCEAFLRVCRRESQTEGLNYLTRRGIAFDAAQKAGVTYFPRTAYARVMRKMRASFATDELIGSGLFNARAHLTFYQHRLLFPFYVAERVSYLQARAIGSRIEQRWHNLRGAIPSLYNADMLNDLTSNSIVYLVEGFTDTLTLLSHGFNAVGIVGANGLREEWTGKLARFQVVCALDPDEAGRRAAARYAEMFERRALRLAVINLPCDVNDFFRVTKDAGARFEKQAMIALS